jgi:hypothetical protein
VAQDISAALGDQRYQKAEVEGRALTLDNAVAEALAIAEEVNGGASRGGTQENVDGASEATGGA